MNPKKDALFTFYPESVVGDNAYFKAMRVRQSAAQGVILVSPATNWKNGWYVETYHHFLEQDPVDSWQKCRKAAIESMFDLFSKVLGTANNHKQLPVQWLAKVRLFLCLGVLVVQIAKVLNSTMCLDCRPGKFSCSYLL